PVFRAFQADFAAELVVAGHARRAESHAGSTASAVDDDALSALALGSEGAAAAVGLAARDDAFCRRRAVVEVVARLRRTSVRARVERSRGPTRSVGLKRLHTVLCCSSDALVGV